MDIFLKMYPNTILEAAGPAVGLPEGYQGSSEVGHLNIGAGRIVEQEITRINEALKDKSFFEKPHFQRVIANCKSNKSPLHLMGLVQEKPHFQRVIANCKSNKSPLHLMGLVQDAGVHAHQDHLFAIMKYAKEKNIKRLYIHFFSDGRDTAPRSALEFLQVLNKKMDEYQIGEIATLMGRYYSMDRGKNWHLTTQAYNALTKAEGIKVSSAEDAVKRAYREDKTPDGSLMTDEYIIPSIIGNFSGIKDGDSVIHFNYRQDRAIQLTMAFVDDK
jgi:2,3-bisphosphoglycerate-independent phosphoglycerate mutase